MNRVKLRDFVVYFKVLWFPTTQVLVLCFTCLRNLLLFQNVTLTTYYLLHHPYVFWNWTCALMQVFFEYERGKISTELKQMAKKLEIIRAAAAERDTEGVSKEERRCIFEMYDRNAELKVKEMYNKHNSTDLCLRLLHRHTSPNQNNIHVGIYNWQLISCTLMSLSELNSCNLLQYVTYRLCTPDLLWHACIGMYLIILQPTVLEMQYFYTFLKTWKSKCQKSASVIA